jgi:hypothetical protein
VIGNEDTKYIEKEEIEEMMHYVGTHWITDAETEE